MNIKLNLPLAVLSLGFLAACSNGGGGSGGNGNKPPDLNDYSTCSGPTSANLSLYDTWSLRGKGDDNVDTFSEFKFDRNQFTIVTNCSKQENGILDQAQANVRSAISVRGNEIEIWSNDTDRGSGRNIQCFAEMKRSKITYSFQGSCLKLSDGTTSYLMPLASNQRNPPSIPGPVVPTNPGDQNGNVSGGIVLPGETLKLTKSFQQFQLNEMSVKGQKYSSIKKTFSFHIGESEFFNIDNEQLSISSCSARAEGVLSYELQGGSLTQSVKLGKPVSLNAGDYRLVVSYLNNSACSNVVLKMAAMQTPRPTSQNDTVNYARLILQDNEKVLIPDEVELNYVQTGKSGKALRAKKLRCQMSGDLKLNARYPKVIYTLGRITCPGIDSDAQRMVTKLVLLGGLQFSTRPAPGANNQVLLSLSSYNYELNPLYKSITSTNSYISETSAFIYVIAKHRSVPWFDQLSLDVSASSLNAKRLKISLKSDKGGDITDEISFVKELR